MRVLTSNASEVAGSMRFDSRYFADRAPLTAIHSGKWPLAVVGDVFGRSNVRLPNIFERIPASSLDFGKPILVPYDSFRYLPYSNDILSRSQTSIFKSLELKRGWLLIVCSGRNLGPVALVDKYMEQFVMSHDMIRICSELTQDLFYFMAVMHTKVGQSLVRRDRNGSVIDHLDDSQVSALQYPLVNPLIRKRCSKAFADAFVLRESARVGIADLSLQFLREAGLDGYEKNLTETDLVRRYTIHKSKLADRFDAERYAPLYEAYRKLLGGRPLEEYADVFKPVGRYKTIYVDEEAHGIKLLSGRQIAQFRPIGLKLMATVAWKNPEEYRLKRGMVLLTADGRAEENLADCAMVGHDRQEWTASGHVHRLVAKAHTHPGLLYLACICKPVQMLFKSLATGSVVDALSVSDVASVPLPMPTGILGRRLGEQAVKAWDDFSRATELEDGAVAELEAELAS